MSISPTFQISELNRQYKESVDAVCDELRNNNATVDEKFTKLANIVQLGTEVVKKISQDATDAYDEASAARQEAEKTKEQLKKWQMRYLKKGADEKIEEITRYIFRRDVEQGLAIVGCALTSPTVFGALAFYKAYTNARKSSINAEAKKWVFENFPVSAEYEDVLEKGINLYHAYKAHLFAAKELTCHETRPASHCEMAQAQNERETANMILQKGRDELKKYVFEEHGLEVGVDAF